MTAVPFRCMPELNRLQYWHRIQVVFYVQNATKQRSINCFPLLPTGGDDDAKALKININSGSGSSPVFRSPYVECISSKNFVP